jgi:hypothetical protein
MREDFAICGCDLEYWIEVLDETIPLEIDGITPEGSEELIKYEYKPRSVRIDYLIDEEEFLRTYLCYLVISYVVTISRMTNFVISVRDECWSAMIPVFLKSEADLSCDLDLSDVNFFMPNPPMDVFI